MSDIVVAIIGLFGTILLALVAVYMARRYGIGPYQEKLVDSLKDLVEAQEQKIIELEGLVKESAQKILELTTDIEKLKKLTVRQALLIQELQQKLEEPQK